MINKNTYICDNLKNANYMYIKQLYTNCLAEAAYYIESNGEAAVIDPIRDIQEYIELAAERGAKIKYVFETHFHADFISGHIDLAALTGAKIVFGPNAETGYEIYNAKDKEVFTIGKIKITAIHTPGHTLESTCYLLTDENGKDNAIFTGDTLFVGDVGRPDLLDGSGITKEKLAGMMYDSLHKKIRPLADDIIVYPAHGPGSACGKNIGKETWSTIGEQKKTNYALKHTTKEKFIETLISGLIAPPAYFFVDASINKKGYDNLESIIKKTANPLPAEDFEHIANRGALILDTRNPDDFAQEFIRGSINIGLNGTFAVWVGSLIDIKQKLILVTELGKEQESIIRLARVGYENIIGYLEGGLSAWIAAEKETDKIVSVTPEEFSMLVHTKSDEILDVRKPSEVADGIVKGATTIPLVDLNDKLEEINMRSSYLVHCAGGYRSIIACSILKALGFHNVKNVLQGYAGIKSIAGVEIVKPEILQPENA
jgi:hydroxyacylglutathione hydrolase